MFKAFYPLFIGFTGKTIHTIIKVEGLKVFENNEPRNTHVRIIRRNIRIRFG